MNLNLFNLGNINGINEVVHKDPSSLCLSDVKESTITIELVNIL